MIDAGEITLRSLEREDFRRLWEIRNEAQVLFWDMHDFGFSFDKLERIYASYFDDEKIELFVIVEKSSEKIVGEFRIYLDWRNRVAQFGLSISHVHWNKGYASEAIKAASNYILYSMDFVRVSVNILQSNQASIKAFTNASFIHEATLKKTILHNGKHEDLLVFARLRA